MATVAAAVAAVPPIRGDAAPEDFLTCVVAKVDGEEGVLAPLRGTCISIHIHEPGRHRGGGEKKGASCQSAAQPPNNCGQAVAVQKWWRGQRHGGALGRRARRPAATAAALAPAAPAPTRGGRARAHDPRDTADGRHTKTASSRGTLSGAAS
eukprot:COSAG01_NODE_1384_length_10514_cov_17.435046_1_plen_151_part_10